MNPFDLVVLGLWTMPADHPIKSIGHPANERTPPALLLWGPKVCQPINPYDVQPNLPIRRSADKKTIKSIHPSVKPSELSPFDLIIAWRPTLVLRAAQRCPPFVMSYYDELYLVSIHFSMLL